MILKSYGRRYGIWFGAGKQSIPQWPITRAWLVTVLPPYMRGVGINFSAQRWSLRIGLYKVIAGYVSDDYDNVDIEGELAALGWGLQDTTAEVITTWVTSTPSETETSETGPSSTPESRPPLTPPRAVPETVPSDSTTPPCSTGQSPSP